jgi:NADP-dependent 3-hydroxy acid dehydrogenase YdfG
VTGVVIVGAGPGLGQAIAARFAREGLPITVIARSQATVDKIADELAGTSDVPVFGLTADAGDETVLRGALEAAVDRFGVPDVLVYNAAIIRPDSVGTLDAAGHLTAWGVNVVGALTTAAAVVPAMAARGTGTVILTGGMPVPVPGYVSLSLGKAGVRALTDLLDQQYGPAGVHVATVTVAGAIAPGTAYDPDVIAEQYWRLHAQSRVDWQREILFDGTST